MRTHSRSGLALILVLTVIMALVVIATPFVLSMIMHEKTAVAERAQRQAGWGAEGVRNFALAQLFRTAESFEREGADKGGSPYMDDPSEFLVDIRDARLKDIKVLDPQGNIWGVEAHDEQGKINVLTAPDRIVLNLRTNLSSRVIDMKDILTLYSGRICRWVRPQKIREMGRITNPLDPTGLRLNGLRVDNAFQLGMGVKVRAIKPGLAPFESKVSRNGLLLIGVHAIETDPPIPGTYLNGLLEIEMRHPVNLNTARRETLAAVYDGLAISVPTGGGTAFKTYEFTSDDGKKVADQLYRKGIWTWHDFLLEARNLDINDMAKAAVIINAIDPGNLLLNNRNEGRGTLGFCFNSNETITIEAFAAVNSNAGTPQGGAGFREVVDLGSPGYLTRSWENQHDFDRMMGPPRVMVSLSGKLPVLPTAMGEALNMSGVMGSGYAGYPFGARMETFPRDLDRAEPSDTTMKSRQGQLQNYISMRTERDHRGFGSLFRHVDHFDEELDGKRIDGAHPIEWGRVVAPQHDRADTSAGGTEFWIKFDATPTGSLPVKLFDLREDDMTNRISVEVLGNQIIFRLTDCTGAISALPLDKGWSELRAPFIPEKDTWYHVAAYWKGTKYGQMMLMIDGFVPKDMKWRHVQAENELPMSTELLSPLATVDRSNPFSSVALKDTSFLVKPENWPRDVPYTVPIVVGDEVIEFEAQSGQGRRGARRADIVYGTQASDHPQDAKVSVFGYTSTFRNFNVLFIYEPVPPELPGELLVRFGGLVATTGKTSLRFGLPQATGVVGEDDVDGEMVLAPTTVRIKYLIPDQVQVDNMEWPDQGYIKINGEAIFYQSITREGAKAGYFEACSRGMEGTIPAVHRTGDNIELWSVAVTTLDGRMPLPTIIQVKEEWFGPANHPQTPVPAPNQFWVGCVVNGRAVSLARGWNYMTEPVIHEIDDPIMPVFAVREVDDTFVRTNLGRFDPVTVVNTGYEKESSIVCRALTFEELNQWKYMQNPMGTPPPPPPRDVAWQGVQVASLFQQVRYQYDVDGRFSRVVKWPSGELIDQRWLARANPAANYGPVKAKIDEVKNVASPKGPFQLAQTLPPETRELRLDHPELIDSNLNRAGIIVSGEELIGYAEYAGDGTFRRLKRGYLNSTKGTHDKGQPAFILNFLPVSALGSKEIGAEQRVIEISQILAGQGYTRGYVLIDEEVIGFEELGLQGVELDSLARFDGSGLFRGMFGTSPMQHQSNSLVFGIPFRYWDGFKRGQFDDRMPHFAVAHTTRDARWNEARYSIEADQGDSNLLPHGHFRIDGLGEMTIPSRDEHSAVWHFSKGQANPLEEYVSSRLENGQIEARFFVEYRPGSYWPNNSWKRTVKLNELRILYSRDPKVLFHEDK